MIPNTEAELLAFVPEGQSFPAAIQVIVATYEFVGDKRTYRLEVRQNLSAPELYFDCAAYARKNDVWVHDVECPWERCSSASNAIRKGIQWIAPRL